VINPRLRAGLVIAAVAVASGIAGAAIERTIVEHRGPRGGRGGGGDRRAPSEQVEQRRREDALDRLTTDLSLTPAQRASLDSIFRRTDSSLRAIRRDMQPRIQQVFERSRADIDARLDSAQRAKFAEKIRAHRGGPDWHGRGGGPPSGGARSGAAPASGAGQ
jgi:hypothetical protein